MTPHCYLCALLFQIKFSFYWHITVEKAWSLDLEFGGDKIFSEAVSYSIKIKTRIIHTL